jgi:hypothetical protein
VTVKVIQVDEDGSETAMIELDDFTIETVYQGIAVMLREATPGQPDGSARTGLSREARQRRQRILTRLSV